jgi:hypothetical protein
MVAGHVSGTPSSAGASVPLEAPRTSDATLAATVRARSTLGSMLIRRS